MDDIGAQALIAVGENQIKLLRAMQRRGQQPPTDTHESRPDKTGRGVVQTLTHVWAAPSMRSQGYGTWRGRLAAFVQSQKITHHRYGEPTVETRWFAATGKLSARHAAHMVKRHWSIENDLHRVRDLRFQEDQHTTQGPRASALADLRTHAFNAVRRIGKTLTKAQQELWRDPRRLLEDFKGIFC